MLSHHVESPSRKARPASAIFEKVTAMKTVDRLVAVLILLLGTIHAGLAPVFRGRYDGAGMWFLSGGLMLIFLALLNLVRSGSPGAAARWAAWAPTS